MRTGFFLALVFVLLGYVFSLRQTHRNQEMMGSETMINLVEEFEGNDETCWGKGTTFMSTSSHTNCCSKSYKKHGIKNHITYWECK